MYKAGFIGYGSMGAMLADGFISAGGLTQRDVILSNRTRGKLEAAREKWPEVALAHSNADVARQARHVFLCVKPADMKDVLDEILPAISIHTHIISTAGAVALESIQSVTGGAVSKVMPTVTSEACAGVSLVCHNSAVRQEDIEFLEGLLGLLGRVKALPEEDFGMAAELTSCMPGFIASIFKELMEAAMRRPEALERAVTQELLLETLLGTARLLSERGMGFDETVRRVATPGGITREGVNVLEAGLPGLFDELLDKTLNKRRELYEHINGSI